jgi:hypothetical protein
MFTPVTISSTVTLPLSSQSPTHGGAASGIVAPSAALGTTKKRAAEEHQNRGAVRHGSA